jgi:hypothetical protein
MESNLNLRVFCFLGCGNEEGVVGDYCTVKFGNPGCLEIDVRPYRQNGKRDRDGANVLICWRTPLRSAPPTPCCWFRAPGSSGTVCSPISQWDLGNNWKPQVSRIWALLLSLNVKISALFSYLQAHFGPWKPKATICFMTADRTLCLSSLLAFAKLFSISNKHLINASVLFTRIVRQGWDILSFFLFIKLQ